MIIIVGDLLEGCHSFVLREREMLDQLRLHFRLLLACRRGDCKDGRGVIIRVERALIVDGRWRI